MSSLQPIILCGGSGTRLWPVSTRAMPKPFKPLLGNRTLFQQTLHRVSDPKLFDRAIVVAGEAHQDHIRNQAPDCKLVLEPAAKNTAPAIALAAGLLDRDAIMLVCPSDHHIAQLPGFVAAVTDAARLAAEGRLVSIGVAPHHPATGYGYIRLGENLGGGNVTDAFIEKPDAARAAEYLASGDYVWNGGIFVFRAGTLLEELARFRPDMAAAIARAVEEGSWAGDIFHPADGPFAAISGESIDYAVMEKTRLAAVVPAEMGWSDIGDWDALATARQEEADAAGNILRGNVDTLDCRNIMVDSDGPRVSVVGLEEVVVIVSGGEVLVTARGSTQKVGKLPGAANQ